VWRLDLQPIETGELMYDRKGFRELRTLQRRTSPKTTDALQEISQGTPAAAPHLTNAWNHALQLSLYGALDLLIGEALTTPPQICWSVAGTAIGVRSSGGVTSRNVLVGQLWPGEGRWVQPTSK